MATAPKLSSEVVYNGSGGSARWEGRRVVNREAFQTFMRDTVRARISDDALSFEDELRGLATTGVATEYVERLLKAVPEPQSWEIGEALAECTLQHDSGREVHWPWNTVRDRRAPRASLPGADLVGFCKDGESILLLFGEVKTSWDAAAPPGVMYGGSGMTWQLDANATRLEIHHVLLRWLLARCRGNHYYEYYQKAVSRYLASMGKELLIIGVLVRDTEPNELDLKSRAEHLSSRLDAPTRVEIIAWYLPIPISEWQDLLKGGAS